MRAPPVPAHAEEPVAEEAHARQRLVLPIRRAAEVKLDGDRFFRPGGAVPARISVPPTCGGTGPRGRAQAQELLSAGSSGSAPPGIRARAPGCRARARTLRDNAPVLGASSRSSTVCGSIHANVAIVAAGSSITVCMPSSTSTPGVAPSGSPDNHASTRRRSPRSVSRRANASTARSRVYRCPHGVDSHMRA